ncbi:Ankyrin repeats (3 copies) [Legionella lansingensis]|uniref:Ankyrin repeats (3 copies) n=1 Tax=Legionella lansingensis TaxID=45067 RepID=A0A0W0VVX0_9GAMM|nr:ankyrin repeat domain-containing protein [Legionella lansingensis]KTD23814.1 Ankyrin repeats (3 copies) [Legionella lansingensis]SNV46890.1 Ankyrin repeats (3 copies) [Legionella lansingensis]
MLEDKDQTELIENINNLLKWLKAEFNAAVSNPDRLKELEEAIGKKEFLDLRKMVESVEPLSEAGVCAGLVCKWFEKTFKRGSSERFFAKFPSRETVEEYENYSLETILLSESKLSNLLSYLKFAKKINALQEKIDPATGKREYGARSHVKMSIAFPVKYVSSTTLVVTQHNLNKLIKKNIELGKFYIIGSPTHAIGLFKNERGQYVVYDPNIDERTFDDAKELAKFIFRKSFNLGAHDKLTFNVSTYYKDEEDLAAIIPLEKELGDLLAYIKANKKRNEPIAQLIIKEINDLLKGNQPIEKQAQKIQSMINKAGDFFDNLPPLKELNGFVLSHHQHRNIVRLLVDDLPLKSKGTYKQLSIIHAIEDGDLLAFETLLKASIDLDKDTILRYGESLLIQAVRNKQIDMITVLANYGADITSILPDVIKEKDPIILQHLINLGVDVNRSFGGIKGITPLDLAVSGGSKEIIKILIIAGVRIPDPKKVANLLESTFEIPSKEEQYHDVLQQLFFDTASIYFNEKNYQQEKNFLIKAAMLGSSQAREYLSSPHLTLNSEDFATLRAGYFLDKLCNITKNLESLKRTFIYNQNSKYKEGIDRELGAVNALIEFLSHNLHSITNEKIDRISGGLAETSADIKQFFNIFQQQNMESKSTEILNLVEQLCHVSDQDLLRVEEGHRLKA